MKAMILAAGRGQRMRPLTDHHPKPLLCVGGKPLIVWHIQRLVRAGMTDILINTAWLGEQIPAALGDGHRFGARLRYSAESPALETAGGIAHALPFFDEQAFLVVNGDIWCDWDPVQAHRHGASLSAQHAAHLVLVDNPDHHPQGDFCLQDDGCVTLPSSACTALTFSGIGIYHPALFQTLARNRAAPLAPVLRDAIRAHRVQGEHHPGAWFDVGTPQRLAALDRLLQIETDC